MYRTIDASFWTDPVVRKIGPEARGLFLYLITNPHTHASGIYYLPRAIVAEETGYAGRQLDTLCHTLSGAALCRFDHDLSIVWVVNMMKHQARGHKNAISAAHHLIEDLHGTPLIADFLEKYPEVKAIVGDRVSIRYPIGYAIGYPVRATPDPDPDPDPDPESSILNPESRTENRETIDKPSPATPEPSVYSESFLEFWEAYPKKVGKGGAYRAWNKLRPSAELRGTILLSVSQHVGSDRWKAENGRYIPNPETFLTQRRFDDVVPRSQKEIDDEEFARLEAEVIARRNGGRR